MGDTSLQLWRAAPAARPWFGHGSYWTSSQDFAQWFAAWADKRMPGRAPHCLYSASVQVADAVHLELPDGVLLESDRFTPRRLRLFADQGFLWLSFVEVPFQVPGSLTSRSAGRQYVYLGADPVSALPIHPMEGTP